MISVSCARIQTADIAAVNRLAHVQLCARRSGCEVCFTDASEDLVALVELVGLGDVLRVEVRRQPEERKEPGGVEEERELADPSA